MSRLPMLADAHAVHGYVRRRCFAAGPTGRVGAELEWLVADAADPGLAVPLERLRRLAADAGPLPGGSTLTWEPGGQVELSSVVASGAAACRAALQADLDHVRRLLAGVGWRIVPAGLDPHRPAVRQLRHPRYDAMEAYFAGLGHELGLVMMASTAAVQVNLDAGRDAADVAWRWHLLHAVGPALSAAFANSPIHHGRPTGWKSTRQRVWLELEPARTHPPAGADPVAAWAAYALAAPVMMLRREGRPWVAAPGFTFGQWVAGQVPGQARPTPDDLAYHLGTLFPPVRPRGWLEVRYVDAQDPQWWAVPVVVLATLLEHRSAGEAAAAACAPVAGQWLEAARHGLGRTDLAAAASAVFAAALHGLGDPDLHDLVARFAARYVERARCPADDRS